MDAGKLFSRLTRQALAATVEDYVSKDVDENALIEQLKRRHGLERVYRFDIGKNTDGYSDLIEGVLEMADLAGLCRQNLVEYPDNHYRLLVGHMAERFGLGSDNFVVTSGLECMIDHVSRVFLQPGDRFLLPIPNFSVFDAFSLRQGAVPLYPSLKRDQGFLWTEDTVERINSLIAGEHPSLVWISNPVNPTGQDLPLAWIKQVVDCAYKHGAAVVVDEAYGEYTDPDYGVSSAAELAPEWPNLMVMRTFSKMHALPSLRVGYLMCSSPEVIKALELYRPMFPFSWFSLFVAQSAFLDEELPIRVRTRTNQRRRKLCERLDGMPDYQYLPSQINTMMLRHRELPVERLWDGLAARGCLTANLNGINGLVGERFIRVTVRAEEDNEVLLAALAAIAGQGSA